MSTPTALRLVGVALLAFVLGACGASPVQQRAMAAEAAKGCKNDPSERAVDLARSKFPDSLVRADPQNWNTPDLWAARTMFLSENRWKFFDFNHDGRMDSKEFYAWRWASYLATAKPGSCIITKQEYFESILGKRGEPLNKGDQKTAEFIRKSVSALYDIQDRDHKGFIRKEDKESEDNRAFYTADTMHRGYLTRDQRF